MSKRAAGVVLSSVGAALFLSRYAFAIWYRGPNPSRWGVDDFNQLLGYVGLMPNVLGILFLFGGLFYLADAHRDERPK